MARKRNQRHYEIKEWLEFELEGMADGYAADFDLDLSDVVDVIDISPELEELRDRFTEQAELVVDRWIETHADFAKDLLESDKVSTPEDIAYNTWAAFTGAGVGFWEDMKDSHWRSLEKAIKADGRLRNLYQQLESEMTDDVLSAVDEVRS